MKILQSGENYLETILMLSRKKAAVRSIDVANEMGYSKPSVSIAMKQLRENGFITVDDGGYITLTEDGREVAERMYERHRLLSEWLVYLGVDPETAAEDACRMEHVISQTAFEKIKAHAEAEMEKRS